MPEGADIDIAAKPQQSPIGQADLNHRRLLDRSGRRRNDRGQFNQAAHRRRVTRTPFGSVACRWFARQFTTKFLFPFTKRTLGELVLLAPRCDSDPRLPLLRDAREPKFTTTPNSFLHADFSILKAKTSKINHPSRCTSMNAH
ncbi:MAG: hypothetical protein V3W41_16695, partial [Planctomycetota bacterium]